MTFIRLLSRVGLLGLAAAVFAGSTGIYGGSVRLPSPDPGWRALRQHRPSAPEFGQFPELIGEGMVLAVYAVAGRIVFRLRLSPASRREGQLIFLGLQKVGKEVPNGAGSGRGPQKPAIGSA